MIIKVCGMRDVANIKAVESLADYMGFIFHPSSPRYVAEKPGYLPTACKRVGVFVNSSLEEVFSRVEDYALDAVQLHGVESEEYCQAIARRFPHLIIIKALSIAQIEDLKATETYDTPHFFLFDTKTPAYGGSGKRFDWRILQHYMGTTPFLLSGGLALENLEDLLAFSHACCVGVDLNSGFETSPGQKDVDRLTTYINTLKATK